MKRLFFLSLLLTIVLTTVSAQTVIYVSTSGDDNGSGEEPTPVKTLEKALLMAREKSGETTVYLRDGEYRLDSPLILTKEDGNSNKSLIIRSYPGEHTVIKGSFPLKTDWKPYRDGILQTHVESPSDIDMLIANGNIRHLARYPNYDPDAVRFNGTSSDATSKSRVRTWKNPEGGFLHAMHVCDWGDFHYRITGRDHEGNLKLEGGWQNNRQIGLSEENRMVENIFEELDAPGEWYYDRNKSILYYYPLEGENPYEMVFEVPCTRHLIELKGCSNVTISGLELTQTERTFMEPYEPLLRSDWTIYRGGAILLEDTENCLIDHCNLNNLGGNAIFFSNYNRDSGVSSCHIANVGASAILFVGNPDAVRSPSFEYGESVPFDNIDLQNGPKSDNYPIYCTVYDNLIHNIGLFEKQVTGVELSMCRDITVSHNSIYDTPRAGINVSDGTWGGHIIEYNDVFDTVKETGDHGSFNSWGRDRFWHPDRSIMDSIVSVEPSLILADVVDPIIIRNNRFRCDRGWDIDLDDGSSNYRIYNNLCLNGGIKLREGFYRNVENNILVNNTFHPHVWFDDSGDVFTRNIVMRPYEPIQVKKWGSMVNYNIFTDSIAYSSAIDNGTDRQSIVANIKFINPEEGDFRVDYKMTDVFRIGFQNFDMDEFGVVSPDLKEIARIPKMPHITRIKNEITDPKIIMWNGYRLKNLSTEGERSATGMDSVRGVYVLAIDESDNQDRSKENQLQINDVILKVEDINICNLYEFLEATSSYTIPVSMTVLRNQQMKNVSFGF